MMVSLMPSIIFGTETTPPQPSDWLGALLEPRRFKKRPRTPLIDYQGVTIYV
jgi:hypothetical protein